MDEGKAGRSYDTGHARRILTPPSPAAPAPPPPPAIIALWREVLRRLAFRGITPVVLLSAILVIESIIAIGKLSQVVSEVQGAAPSPTPARTQVAVVGASPTVAPSDSASPSASATAGGGGGPVRTPTRTAPPPPTCDNKTHRVSGRVTLSDGSAVYNASIEFYRASDGGYVTTYHSDSSGGFNAVVGANTYKLFFIPSVAAQSQWWNAKSSKAVANVVSACTGDAAGVNAVLVRF